MFSNGHRERLPPVEKGHILILRQIEVVNYDNTLMGTGYADKFQWAIYDPKTKEIHHGESLEADTAEPTHPAPSPFFHPSFEDRAYCEELAGWKQALPKSSEAVRREHRLICDAGPNVPPQGYFDCTVEVLHVEENENGIISLYVTDYTSNPKVCPRWADWCPKALSADKVLRIEMRDDAAKVGVTMNKGEYYTIKNARMIDSSGYLEAKAREKKTRPAYKQDLGEACARRLGSVRVERDVGRNGGATNVTMRLTWALLVPFSAHLLVQAAKPAKRTYDTHHYYVLEHDPQAASLADIAQALGVEIVEKAGELANHWLVRTEKSPGALVARKSHDRVLATYHEYRKRALQAQSNSLTSRSETDLIARKVSRSVKYLSKQELRQRVKRAPPPALPEAPASESIAIRLGIEDPLFTEQWHLVNDEYPEHMMNPVPVWDLGITGKGVISSLVDDGLDYESVDLADNFDAENSYDFNDHEDLPTPKLFDDHHGTRCAGQVAAIKNDACGIGIAYESKVAGVRILSGPISDIDEAAALNYGYQNVSIYSCSWGPPDNGQSMEGPGFLIKKAVLNGINNGRGGKGSIFVFASGNGAAQNDQCNFDGYTNSIYSVTVSALDYKGLHPYYSEPCAANMIVAYSSGSGRHIVTTDKGKNQCAKTHGGTSAAAPNAVGVFALALEARPELTWRDIQYLCVETARIVNADDPDWDVTATGRKYSYKYGFGALDAYEYVTAARDWELVKPQTWITTHSVQHGNGTMDEDELFTGGDFIPADGIDSTMSITQEMLDQHNFETLEHINVKVWIQHTKRGDVEVALISPNGVKSVLAAPRVADSADTGYPGWTFMTVKHWGENPVGTWTLHINDQGNPAENNGSFIGWNMVLWGACRDPSKASLLELLHDDDTFPPPEDAEIPTTVASTTQHTKPTALLPGDHGEAEGENTRPAFTSVAPSGTVSPTPAISGTPDEGWFPGLSNLVSNQKWFFGAIGAVSVFGIGIGVWFWRRRAAQQRAASGYGSLSDGDEVGMTALGDRHSGAGGAFGLSRGGGGVTRTRELYDAFGVGDDDDDDDDDDDEDADEATALRKPQGASRSGGYLDEDLVPGPSSRIGGSSSVPYRDEPRGPSAAGRQTSASPDGSGDGSWEDASLSRS
ncbi:hypothetical protein AX16_008837 [Volvariella volvacea WC 439]|nr:hypothetical protein AX16_008837 [Volvariella volvacea WC 439]